MSEHLYLIQTEDLSGNILPGVTMHAESPNGPWDGITNKCGQFAPTLAEGSYQVDFFLNGRNIGHRDWVLADPPREVIRVGLDQGIPPITVDIRKWRGAFCIPGALPGQPAGFGDGERIWTPAYGAYDDVWRPRILAAFKARGYTHFVYNTASPNGVYHNDYPKTADDPARARRDLIEIRAAGLVPVCPAYDDTMLDAPLESFRQNADLIPVCFPMWEMNGPFEGDTARINACVLATRAAAPAADCYIHFTAGHGAGGEPEGAWWQWAASVGVVGLLSQDDGYERKPDGDVEGTAAGLVDTQRHFRGEVAGWEGLNLLNVAFEQITTPLYHSGWTEAQQLAYGAELMTLAKGIAGFCDGGPV